MTLLALALLSGDGWIDRPPGSGPDISLHRDDRRASEADDDVIIDFGGSVVHKGRPPAIGGGFGWTIFWSIVVIALLAVTLWALRRYVARSRFAGGGGVVNVLARASLDQHSRLYVVELGETVFLVGGTRDRLNSLGTIRDPEEVAAVRRRATGKEQAAFKAALGEEIKSAERGEGLQKLREQLGDLKATVKRWGGAKA